MNAHYHPYAELASPHPPSPDNNNSSYSPALGGGRPGGGGTGGGGGGAGAGAGGGGGGMHQHQQQQHQHGQHGQQMMNGHHHGNGPAQMNTIEGHQQGFHHSNNNVPIKQCMGCSRKISERYFLQALDGFWHNACLKCSMCEAHLANMPSCYSKGGMILCKPDYTRMFGCPGACNGCGETIPSDELVMRTTSQGSNNQPPPPNPAGHPNQPIQHYVFHIKCFRCSKCVVPLRAGDRYYMLAGTLVCENDWLKLHKLTGAGAAGGGAAGAGGAAGGGGAGAPVRKGKVGRPRRSRD